MSQDKTADSQSLTQEILSSYSPREIDILLVEDSENDAHMVQRIVRKEQLAASIHWLKDGEEAIEYFDNVGSARPRLILLDIKLPKYSGLEVVEHLRKQDDLWSIPVVMFSTSDQPTDIHRAYRAGANSFLIKPGSYVTLKEVIREICSYWLNLNRAH